MGNKWRSLKVHKETKDKLENECKIELLKNRPYLKGMNISNNYILTQIIEYWLK